MNTQNIKLSLTPGIIRPIVAASQYDTARPVSLSYDDNITFTTVEIHGTRPDGAKVTQAVTASGLVISWTPSADFTAIDGDVLAEAVFLRSGSRVGTANFILRVEPAGAKEDAPGLHDTLTVTAPGTYNVRPYAQVIVDIDAPSGNLDVNANGVYSVEGKSTVRVAVPEPSGAAAITENGRYDVKDKAVAAVNVPVGVFPEGTAEITENGTYNVTDKETARVAVPVGVIPEGTKRITANGSNINVHEYEAVDVAVPVGIVPEGTAEITENGTYNVRDKETVEVSVPVGVFPSGVAAITENGQYDVEQYKTARVNVPVGIFPEGTALITRNGLYEIEQYEKARVNVPAGIVPEGTLQITANGTYDVTEKAAAAVNVAPDYDDLLAGRLTEITTQTSTLSFYALYHQDSLETINAPNLSILQAHCLENCHALTSLTIPVGGGWISDSALNKCYHFTDLYLPDDEITELDNVNAFWETEFDVAGGGTGTIHVKASLENTYKNATNWSYYAQRIVGDL